MADAPIPEAAAPNSKFHTVTLEEPITRGQKRIETLNIRKPQAGELRNLSLQDLMQSDITALLKLIPRVSDPPLTQDEADALGLVDLAEIGGTVRGFFMSKAEKAAVDAMIADQLKT